MTALLRFLLFVVLASLIRFLFSRLRKPAGARFRTTMGTRQGARRVVSGHMIKDPNCGTYVASELAVPLRRGGRTLYFCSSKCRDEFARLQS